MNAQEQSARIVEQFTRQAAAFRKMPAHSDEEAHRLVIEAAGVGPDDRVLDVACGPGLTSCRLAEVAREVTGIDLTPAMIEQAKLHQQTRGLLNVSWRVGDASSLPFPDGAFSLVFTRYSFHHILTPLAVLREMVRVAEPGGRVAVVDVYSSSPEQAEAYDHVERLRDPSHVHALGLDELLSTFQAAGLQDPTATFYDLDVALDPLLDATFTDAEAADEVRRLFAEDLDKNQIGVGARRVDGQIWFAFPIAIVVGRTPS